MRRANRDASDASIRMRKNDRLPGDKHLLSTYNRPSYEPAVDAPPLSSDEEEEQEEDLGEDEDVPALSYKQDSSQDQRFRGDEKDRLEDRKPLARTSSQVSGDFDRNYQWESSCGSQKRAKNTKYANQRNPAAIRAPTPYKSTLQDNHARSMESENNKAEDTGPPPPQFIVPRDIINGSSSSSCSGALSGAVLSQFDTELLSSSNGTPLSSAPSSLGDDASALDPEGPAVCPMCKANVDSELLRKFQSQPKQRIREQQEFCASHQIDSAAGEYKEQGYPEINWDTFNERIQSFFPVLEKLLKPDTPSYYRNLLDTEQKNGKNLRPTIDSDAYELTSCGYYGPKGGQNMLDAIMNRFAAGLRRLAKVDGLVTKVGVVGYAQCVLVPELTVQLIKDDMSVSDDEAREIMRKSVDLGLRLNPQKDTVAIGEELDPSEDDGSDFSAAGQDQDEEA